jgi:hypothetical protein
MVQKGKKRRKRTKSPEEIRQGVGGFYRAQIERKTCGECGEMRNSVDSSGSCGYCRAQLIIR